MKVSLKIGDLELPLNSISRIEKPSTIIFTFDDHITDLTYRNISELLRTTIGRDGHKILIVEKGSVEVRDLDESTKA